MLRDASADPSSQSSLRKFWSGCERVWCVADVREVVKAPARTVSPIYLVSPVDDSPPDEPPFVYGAALFFRCSREDCRRSMPGLEDIAAGARKKRCTRRR